MAGVIEMSDRELTRLRVMIDLADGRLTVNAAATLLGLGRRQTYRLRRIFSADGPAGLASRKRGRPSNRKYGETFRATVLSLVREHYPDFGPTLAVEKLVARHGLRIGVETLRVAAGGSAPPIPSAVRRVGAVVRPGRESRRLNRTKKLS